MHMISKKDLNSAEMDTLTKSCSPANILHYGSLEDAPAVLSLLR